MMPLLLPLIHGVDQERNMASVPHFVPVRARGHDWYPLQA